MIYFVPSSYKVPAGRDTTRTVWFCRRRDSFAEAARAISIREHHTSLFILITMFFCLFCTSASAVSSMRYDIQASKGLFIRKRKTYLYQTEVEWTGAKDLKLSGVKQPAIVAGAPPEFRGREENWSPEVAFQVYPPGKGLSVFSGTRGGKPFFAFCASPSPVDLFRRSKLNIGR
jgi:hypothetical protein